MLHRSALAPMLVLAVLLALAALGPAASAFGARNGSPSAALIPVEEQASQTEGSSHNSNNTASSASIEEASHELSHQDPFVATDEWQEVQPGQAIPAGLHVSIDMQTGKKMAKKLDPNETNSTDHTLGRQTLSEKRQAKLELTAKLLQEAEQQQQQQQQQQLIVPSNSSDADIVHADTNTDDTDTDTTTPEGEEARLRTLANELANKWEKQPLPHQEEGVRVGLRILKRITAQPTPALLSNPESNTQLLDDLAELEDILHDWEVAVELNEAGLLSILRDLLVEISHLLSEPADHHTNASTNMNTDTNTDMDMGRGGADVDATAAGKRQQAVYSALQTLNSDAVDTLLASLCLTLGTSMQNNAPVAATLATPTLSRAAVRLLERHGGARASTMHKRVLYLLSSMVRSRPELVAAWVQSPPAHATTQAPRDSSSNSSNNQQQQQQQQQHDGAGVFERLVSYYNSVLVQSFSPATPPSSSSTSDHVPLYDGAQALAALRKTSTLLADAIEAEMSVVCPHLLDPESAGEAADEAHASAHVHEMDRLEMAAVRMRSAGTCAATTTEMLAGTCPNLVSAWASHNHSLTLHQALLELLALLPCPWSPAPSARPDQAASAAPPLQVLQQRVNEWQQAADQELEEEGEPGMFALLKGLAVVVRDEAQAKRGGKTGA